MTRITQTKLARAVYREVIERTKNGQPRLGPDGKPYKVKKLARFKPAQPRELVTCKCGKQKYLSVGQLWICHHEKEGS